MYYPSLEELKAFTDSYNLVPVVKEIYADQFTPIQVLLKLQNKDNNVFLLESANNTGIRGRYSILGLNPESEITVNGSIITVKENDKSITLEGNPIEVVEELIGKYNSPTIEGLPAFTGGYVGYISYDFYRFKEPILSFSNSDPYQFSDLHLNLYKEVIVFDHFTDKLHLIKNIDASKLEEEYPKAQKRLDELETLIEGAVDEIPEGKIKETFTPTFTQDEYSQVIDKARDYIIEGDIFQVVPSNRIKGQIEGSLIPAYRIMRSDNPSPYMYYLKFGDEEIAGASPETLVRIEEDRVSTFPIAGSRPRGESPEEDRSLEEELLQDKKELAEHNMLVDLGRNDLGRIAKHGSVEVTDYQMIQKYSKVMHITSRVEADLKEDVSTLEALSTVLPAGTLSGAPKIRACQIIEELETEKRGPYGGAIGYFAFNGNMDMCIAIRSAFKKGDLAFAQSGGGIVYDSKADKEYEETVNKAAAVIEAVEKGEQLQ